MGYGWRGRIGLIVPSSNTTMEPEFYRLIPNGVSIHSSRVMLEEVTPEGLKSMADWSHRAAGELVTAKVNIIVYGCTTGALLGGLDWERKLASDIGAKFDITTITTAGAVVEALKALQAKKVTVATPYIQRLNELMKSFLEANGFDVVNIEGLGIVRNTEIGLQPPTKAYEISKRAYRRGSDCLLISCTNLRTVEVIDILEEELGVPVVSSNTATLWAALKRLNIGKTRKCAGTLLREFI